MFESFVVTMSLFRSFCFGEKRNELNVADEFQISRTCRVDLAQSIRCFHGTAYKKDDQHVDNREPFR